MGAVGAGGGAGGARATGGLRRARRTGISVLRGGKRDANGNIVPVQQVTRYGTNTGTQGAGTQYSVLRGGRRNPETGQVERVRRVIRGRRK